MDNNLKSGYVAVIGRPNVGKSTLVNALTGEKIAIVSNKPQTTRRRIMGVITGEDYQAVFIDTPGFFEPTSKLGGYMVGAAESALPDADIILFTTEADAKNHKGDLEILKRLRGSKTPVFLVINKIDKIPKPEILTAIEKYKNLHAFREIIPISALTGENADALLDAVRTYLPLGPRYFPGDYLTDMTERQIISEIIREKALYVLRDEIPHGIAVETTGVKQKKDSADVDAAIYCEKDSHKPIVIGKNGAVLKSIGQAARPEIERLLGVPVFLRTWVKVKKNWRDDDFMLKTLGYRR